MELDGKAGRKANALTWVGLGLMSVQFGVLARLTWWEYSWDVSSLIEWRVLIAFVSFHHAQCFNSSSDYGTSDVLRDIRNSNGCLCLFRVDETSEIFSQTISVDDY